MIFFYPHPSQPPSELGIGRDEGSEAQRGEVTCRGHTGLGKGSPGLTLNLVCFPLPSAVYPGGTQGVGALMHTLATKAFSGPPACRPRLVRPLPFQLLDRQLALTSACSPLTGRGPLKPAAFLIHPCTPHRHGLPRARSQSKADAAQTAVVDTHVTQVAREPMT